MKTGQSKAALVVHKQGGSGLQGHRRLSSSLLMPLLWFREFNDVKIISVLSSSSLQANHHYSEVRGRHSFSSRPMQPRERLYKWNYVQWTFCFKSNETVWSKLNWKKTDIWIITTKKGQLKEVTERLRWLVSGTSIRLVKRVFKTELMATRWHACRNTCLQAQATALPPSVAAQGLWLQKMPSQKRDC